MSISIFGIGLEYQALKDLIENDLEVDEETGEITNNDEVFKQLFDELQVSLEDKLNNYQRVILELNGSVDTLDKEIKRLQARKKAINNNIDRMKQAMLGGILASGQTKIKTDLFSFNTRKSESVDIVNIDDLGREFLRIKYEADKTKIKEVLKSGETVEGARLVENTSLSIR